MLEYYLHSEGLERVSGTWDVVADYGTKTVTSSNGPFKLIIDGSSVGIAEESSLLPSEFKLYPNSPNPFNPSTVIEFDLPEEEHVSVVIYNLLGNEVRALSIGRRTAGRHHALWDGRDSFGKPVDSGVYFCAVTAGANRQIIKMTLLK